MNTRLIKQFFSFSLGGYISLLIGFISLPFVTRLISPEQYGVFSLFSLILNLQLIFLLLGLDQGFVRYFYETENKMKALVEARSQGIVEFNTEVDPSLIGGFILEYDTYRMDASVKNKLNAILTQLTK